MPTTPPPVPAQQPHRPLTRTPTPPSASRPSTPPLGRLTTAAGHPLQFPPGAVPSTPPPRTNIPHASSSALLLRRGHIPSATPSALHLGRGHVSPASSSSRRGCVLPAIPSALFPRRGHVSPAGSSALLSCGGHVSPVTRSVALSGRSYFPPANPSAPPPPRGHIPPASLAVLPPRRGCSSVWRAAAFPASLPRPDRVRLPTGLSAFRSPSSARPSALLPLPNRFSPPRPSLHSPGCTSAPPHPHNHLPPGRVIHIPPPHPQPTRFHFPTPVTPVNWDRGRPPGGWGLPGVGGWAVVKRWGKGSLDGGLGWVGLGGWV